MSGENEINTGFLSCRREIVPDVVVDCLCVGTVCRNVHGKNLPLAIALFCIAYQPRKSLIIVSVGGIVYNRYIHIAIFH